MRRVAVIGGGPGGAHCARVLGEAGFPVTLFEPRVQFEKACGGGMPFRALERYPFLNDSRLPGKQIHECLLVAPSGREARFPLRDPLYVFGRADLHAFLLERAASAGVGIERARVVGFRTAPTRSGSLPGWVLDTVSAGAPVASHGPFDYLVAADGASGSARRRLLGSTERVEVSQGIGYYLPQVSEDFITLKFYAGLHGYLWVFPRPDHSSAGICASLGRQPAAALRTLMDDFLRERYPAATLEAADDYAALIPSAPRVARGSILQGDGWALVGDAGRAVDPLTREGIYYAMLSGQMVAEALVAGRPESYPDRWEKECARELSWAARHSDGFFATRFVETMVFLSAISPPVATVLSDLISGRQPYRTLKRQLLLVSPRVGLDCLRFGGRTLMGPRGS